MAFPTTSILDDFAGSAENPIATGWSGPWWEEWSSTQARRTGGGEATGQSGGNLGSSYWDLATFGPDSEAALKVGTINWNTGDSAFVGVRLVNIGTDTTDGYMLRLQWQGGSGSDEFHIYRLDDNVRTLLGASFTSLTFTSNDLFGLEVIGTTLKGYFKDSAGSWTEKLSRTDATYSAAGRIAMALEGDLTNVDDFLGGTVVGAGANPHGPFGHPLYGPFAGPVS